MEKLMVLAILGLAVVAGLGGATLLALLQPLFKALGG